VCKVAVDGTDFRIFNWKPFWTGWFSHKFEGPGLRYDVAVSIKGGKVVWINGPFPAGKWPDISIFREALIHMLDVGEKAIADKGYRGEDEHIVIPEGSSGRGVRARHETVNGEYVTTGWCRWR